MQNSQLDLRHGSAGPAGSTPFSAGNTRIFIRNGSCELSHVPYDNGQNIRERTFQFGCDVVRLAMANARGGSWPVTNQLVRSATSIGANLVEAKSASSRREFIRMCEISLREAREAVYWLRVCLAVPLLPAEAHALCAEGEELVRILSTIVLRTKLGRSAKQD